MTRRSPALQAYDREHSAVLAEYRKRETDSPGAGDLWISTRTEALHALRKHDEGVSPQVRVGSGSGPGANLHRGDSNARTASGDPLRAPMRDARAREARPGRLSTLLGGGGV